MNREYNKCQDRLKWKKIFYVNVLQAINVSCPRMAHLFSTTLQDDKCVANKIINGKQFTLAWYIDDNKLSHVEEKVVAEMLEVLK